MRRSCEDCFNSSTGTEKHTPSVLLSTDEDLPRGSARLRQHDRPNSRNPLRSAERGGILGLGCDPSRKRVKTRRDTMQLNRAIRSAHAKRVLFFVLALAACCQRPAEAQSSFWPIKKDRDLDSIAIRTDDTQATAQDLIFSVDAQTRIVADSASTTGELFVSGDSTGISARLEVMEDELEDIRQEYNTMMSLDSLETANATCYDVLKNNLTARIEALEDELDRTTAPYVLRPPQCTNDGVAGLTRETIDGVSQWRCRCRDNFTSTDTSDYGTCTVESCPLPAEFLGDSSIMNSDCATSHLKDGGTCTFWCDANNQPNGTTAGSVGTLSCSNGFASGSTRCEACAKSYKGENCYKGSCDLYTLDVSSATNFENIDCSLTSGSYMATSDSCSYNCLSDTMPVGVSSIDTAGKLSCSNDPVDNPGEEFAPGVTEAGIAPNPLSPLSTTSTTPPILCQSCADGGFAGHKGKNCRQEPCDLTAIFTPESPIANFLAGDCPTDSYLEADGTCNFDCEAGYMPVGISNTGAGTTGGVNRGTLTCSNDGGITTDDSGATVTSSSALCQACTSLAYSGKNCGLDSCVINSVLSKTNVTNVDCHSTYLAADANCFYDCANSMPIAATAHDTSGVIHCADTGAVTGDDGITPVSTGAFCQSCADGGFPGYTGTNCEYEACDLTAIFTPETPIANFVNGDCPTGSYMTAGGTCNFDCEAGYMPVGVANRGTSGTLSCASDGGATTDNNGDDVTASSVLCTACTSQYSGQNCGLDSCPTTSVLAKTNVTNVDCDASYLAAGATCTYNCADGSMPIGATQTGQSGTIACAATGATGGNDGITPSGTEACQSCAAFGVPGNTGVNCATAPQHGGTT